MMVSLAFVSASEVVIGDVADKFKLPCQRVHAVTVAVCRRSVSNRRYFLILPSMYWYPFGCNENLFR